jgi:hypothetical protein
VILNFLAKSGSLAIELDLDFVEAAVLIRRQHGFGLGFGGAHRFSILGSRGSTAPRSIGSHLSGEGVEFGKLVGRELKVGSDVSPTEESGGTASATTPALAETALGKRKTSE